MAISHHPVRTEAAWHGREGRLLVRSGATFNRQGDPNAMYRYSLWREYEKCAHDVETMLFVMLNPSTAGESVDDATIRRCCDFALRRDYMRIEVVNLFAFRATDPKQLATAQDPVGPLNDGYIRRAAKLASVVVCAWGASAPRGVDFDGRRDDVLSILRREHRDLYCLGTCANEEPRHPVRLAINTKLEVLLP